MDSVQMEDASTRAKHFLRQAHLRQNSCSCNKSGSACCGKSFDIQLENSSATLISNFRALLPPLWSLWTSTDFSGNSSVRCCWGSHPYQVHWISISAKPWKQCVRTSKVLLLIRRAVHAMCKCTVSHVLRRLSRLASLVQLPCNDFSVIVMKSLLFPRDNSDVHRKSAKWITRCCKWSSVAVRKQTKIVLAIPGLGIQCKKWPLKRIIQAVFLSTKQ